MISLVFDVVIAILLVVTIVFCVVLCKRLKRLRADEEMMRAVVADIVQSTGKAEHAIRTLKATADECDHTLGVHLRDADLVIDDMKSTMADAEKVAHRVAEMVAIAKSAPIVEKPVSKPVPEPANQTGPAALTEDIRAPLPQDEAVTVSALEALRSRAA